MCLWALREGGPKLPPKSHTANVSGGHRLDEHHWSKIVTRTTFIVGALPENAKGGGAKKRVGQNLTRRPPTENSFRPPSPRYVLPPPPYGISLSKSLRSAQNFSQLTSSETAFGGSQKIVSDGPSSRGFAFRYVLPPPLALPSLLGH